MLKIDFTQEYIDKLHYERYPYPLVQKKMEVLYLKIQGIKHKDICSWCKIEKTRLINSLH
ncbi:Mobile element protein [Richelia intracellularis]|nr:Mobile element protein [Richelia intracellularis]